ncbi:unnamed protein product [Pleuronectes platessa]|uniref:Uncharacterized protein n=1 Tax=Pleuronectes platessa TaxID=8262 RepID=A0A9N7YAP1_PLEPL|nr:unnamed protein product [Pleuronectes platessa]
MWSGPGVTGERPESVELTTLLTIKRQPDTASSSSPTVLSKAGIANPCLPRGETQDSKPTIFCGASHGSLNAIYRSRLLQRCSISSLSAPSSEVRRAASSPCSSNKVGSGKGQR